jgi:hypothetical protein
MTNAEKMAAMVQRCPHMATEDHDEGYFSFIVIMGHMNYLVSNGLVSQIEWEISESGKDFLALCQEFDWKISMEDITDFVSEWIPEEKKFEVARLLYVLNKDEENFKKSVTKMKNNR